MTKPNPDSGADIALPTVRDLHEKSMLLEGLIAAMLAQLDCVAKDGDGLWACIAVAGPLSRDLTTNLERIM